MKVQHWTYHLPKSTVNLKRYGRMITALEYEITELEFKVTALKNQYKKMDNECIDIAKNFCTPQQILEAKIVAQIKNNTAIKTTRPNEKL